MNWYVLYTRSRYEKAVAEKLALAGMEGYCAVLKTRKKWSDRYKWVEEPLFRSYCFVKTDEKEREKALRVAGVVRFLYHCGKPAIIREKDMEVVKSWLMNYDHEKIEVVNLSEKDRILIRTGALIGQEAEVIESKGNYALLYLESLGTKVKVDLRKNIVEKLTAG